jgi:hypothetical protein
MEHRAHRRSMSLEASPLILMISRTIAFGAPDADTSCSSN